MRNRIGKKLNITNALIVVIALLIYCILSIGIFNFYMKRTIKEQLLVENRAYYRLAIVGLAERTSDDNNPKRVTYESLLKKSGNFQQPNVYKALTESTSLIFVQSEKDEKYEMVYSSIGDFDVQYDLFNLQERINESRDGVIQLNINSTDYFCTLQSSKPRGINNSSLVVVSLIPLSSIKIVNRQYILLFLITTIFLVLLSVAVISLMSARITKPIAKVTDLTKQYAKREFKNKYIANTNDEVEDLSKAVSKMADSLEKQDIQREKMFRNISHELKTPLTAIYGYAEGLKNGVFKNTDEPLDIIMSESLRIKKMTEDIIYLSKLESHIEVFKLTKCDISSIMAKAIQSIESIAIMNDIDIRYIPSKIDTVNVDEDKIHRALINILSNSVKYTKDIVDIEIRDIRDGVEIIVADNGNGFRDEDIKNLLSGMTKEKSNGSGIGLSIVNEIIKGHNGEFYIGNNKAGGAIFNIILKK